MGEIFFSQLLNNLQTLPVYSLKLYSRPKRNDKERETSNERERSRRTAFGQSTMERGNGQQRGVVNTREERETEHIVEKEAER